MEMVRWWLMEPALINKLFDDIIPRLRDTPEPYTYLLQLPQERILSYKDKRVERWFHYEVGVLEINGLFVFQALCVPHTLHFRQSFPFH